MSVPSAPQAWNLRVYVREKIIEYLQEFHPHSLPQHRVQMIKEN
jgi:hypothetical protein